MTNIIKNSIHYYVHYYANFYLQQLLFLMSREKVFIYPPCTQFMICSNGILEVGFYKHAMQVNYDIWIKNILFYDLLA